ncbi:metallophosphoesterase [Hoyosella sp. G463]|uniref:Metallophosphoesterase n=1 Tax=Lolliginicoccus lacisalsi TaxID=2742202 RepID=A0A927JF40_9ACTN|nr:metallophosphoesterase [Lolliginicoccus lacisalsi]MBD8507617.1 metallophosphoesterase [Lolliginicoccus lacisalsi]
MLLFLAITALFIGAIHLWLHHALVSAARLGPRARRLGQITLAILWAAAIASLAVGIHIPMSWGRPIGYLGGIWFAVLFYLVPALVLISVVALLARAIRMDASRILGARRAATALVVVAVLAVCGWGTWNAHQLTVREARIAVPGLPPGFDGARIALVADLHLGPALGEEFARKATELVNEQDPDLILVGGDLIDGTIAQVGPATMPLAALRAPLGVHVVSGNHEYYADDADAWLDYFAGLGMNPLRNQRIELQREGDTIDLAGVNDYDAPAPRPADLDEALGGRDTERTLLLLAHQPRHINAAAEAGVDVQFSGHTHGGQLWPFGYLVALTQDVAITGLDMLASDAQGRGAERGTQIYTTSGAGAWGPPVRIGTTPEIVIIELVRE